MRYRVKNPILVGCPDATVSLTSLGGGEMTPTTSQAAAGAGKQHRSVAALCVCAGTAASIRAPIHA